MTFKVAFNSTKIWQRKVVLVSLYHNSQLARNKHWKLINSANYFNVSIGLISENLKLNKEWDIIKDCDSRNKALKLLK